MGKTPPIERDARSGTDSGGVTPNAGTVASTPKKHKVKRVGGAFRPGESGNLNGRPPVGLSIAEILRRKIPAEELCALVAEIARNGEKDADRIKAITFIFDRAWPPPPMKIEHSGAIATTGVLVIPAMAVTAAALHDEGLLPPKGDGE